MASKKTSKTEIGPRSRAEIIFWIALAASLLLIYSQATQFEFINLDDAYVYNSPQVSRGLTLDGLKWAFTAIVAGNWIPLTLLSHLLDGQLFQLNSGLHHLMNVIYHTISAALLFLFIRRATRETWPAAFIALVFAVHPLHVESVAWVVERKDVLSTAFYFGGLYSYVLYVEKPRPAKYLIVFACLLLGLAAKPMLVTFPFVLLLFDFWPLHRSRSWRQLVIEKIPLFALIAASSVVTFIVQRSTGSVDISIPFSTRLANALVSYAIYIEQTLLPVSLAIFYPHTTLPAWEIVLALLLLLAITALAIANWRRRPYLLTGWLFYLGTLVPVIGLVQVGLQAHADRYTYIPMVGLLIIIAWSVRDAVSRWPRLRSSVLPVSAALLIVLTLTARVQAGYWLNSGTVFQHALDAGYESFVAEGNLASYLLTSGRGSEAIPHLQAALRLRPDDPLANNSMGAVLLMNKRDNEALPYFEAALRFDPGYTDARYHYAMALSHLDRTAEAIAQYQKVLEAHPDNDMAHNNLGLLLARSGHTDQAIPHFEAAVRLHPDFSSEYNLGYALLTVPARQAEGIAHLELAQRIRPTPEVARTISQFHTGK